VIDKASIRRIAEEVAVTFDQATAVVRLLDDDATLPFIVRYRKDATGNLGEAKIEAIACRRTHYAALASRRASILGNIAGQGKLTDALREKITTCFDSWALEDLYLPYKKKRRTRATVARVQGLGPLADFLWEQLPAEQPVEEYAKAFVRAEKALSSVEEALAGAQDIIAERISTDPDVRGLVRERMLKQGKIASFSTKNAEGKKTKFETYYDFSERVATIPSHRFLAILRGVKEGYLRMELAIDDDRMRAELTARYLKQPGSVFEPYIGLAVADAYARHLKPPIEDEAITALRARCDEEAIDVFRENARNLFMAPPAGPVPVIGMIAAANTAVTLAAVDAAGAFRESADIYPLPPHNKTEEAEQVLLALMQKHRVTALAIGNGNKARETARFVNDVLKRLGREDTFATFVNESGAAAYAASKAAREEFPDSSPAIRSAISIARRFQDPLAELVKVDPRNAGVGQYQHDVSQKRLRDGLRQTVASCVNHVGVNLNTASLDMLTYVSGLRQAVAQNIVKFREKSGPFEGREQLLQVEGVDAKVYQQAVGFLRVTAAVNPLDATAIHPEAYDVVARIADGLGLTIDQLINSPDSLEGMDLSKFKNDAVGTFTLEDIRAELLRPGKDPRSEFKAPKFLEGVNAVEDLEVGMEIEGVVTNVTNFGAFVDIGIHQDGLVHLSQLANRYVRDPRDVVRVGQIVKTTVIQVDKDLPRVSLSMKALLREPSKRTRKRAKRKATAGEAAASAQTRGRTKARANDKAKQTTKRPHAKRGRGKKRETAPPLKTQRGRSRNTDEIFNTALADQLAALKDKFTS